MRRRMAQEARNRAIRGVLATALGICGLAAVPLSPARAEPIAFAFAFTDGPGVGFNDPVFGQQARDALATAGQIWGRRLASSYPGETISVTAGFSNGCVAFGCTPGAPGGFTTVPGFIFGAGSAASDVPAALANHVLLTDLTPRTASSAGAELNLSFNEAQEYFFGTELPPSTEPFDFIRIALHEIGHGLGFVSSVRADGSFAFVAGFGNVPHVYDRFVVDEFGTPITAMTDAERLAAVTDPGNILWAGANGVEGNGGRMPVLVAAPTFAPAVSIGHVDSFRTNRTDLIVSARG